MPGGGSKPGERRGGRQKGTVNKSIQTIRERLAAMNCDYIGYLANTVNNNVPCAVCRGAGKTKFQPKGGERFSGERTCQSCWGSGLERIEPKESAKAAAELMSYCEAKRKPVDDTGNADDNHNIRVTVEYVSAAKA
jgi:DnaJ-class molecular chaperone